MRDRLHRLPLVIGILLAALACDRSASVPAAQGEVRGVAPDELAALVHRADGPLLLDVRTPAEYAAGHVPGARNIPIDELPGRVGEIEPYRERGVVTYCERGGRAAAALRVLREAGFRDLAHLEGDMARWRREGRPIERGTP